MRLLELFSGTGSVGRPWRETGHWVVSADADGRFGANIVEDILQLSYCKLPAPDVIRASPHVTNMQGAGPGPQLQETWS